MRLAYIVTNYPSVSETFIARELIEYSKSGVDIRIYHLTNFKDDITPHKFLKPTLAWTRSRPLILNRDIFSSLNWTLRHKSSTFLKAIFQLIRGYWLNPVLLAKSLLVVPKTLWISKDIMDWKADHIHAGFAGHPSTCAWLTNKLTGIPFSFSGHGTDIFRSQLFLDKKINNASFVRVISQYNRDFLIKNVPNLKRSANITVVHCGLDIREKSINNNNPSKVFNIVFVGRLTPVKGTDVLLAAVAGLSNDIDWKLIVAGDGPERSKLEAKANSLEISNKIEFLGNVSNERVGELMSSSDVLVLPSIPFGGRREGIPTVLMEALLRGLPVIASELAGIPELVHHEKTGYLVPPGDSYAITNALRKVKIELREAKVRASQGRELVLTEFNIENVAQEMLKLFQNCKLEKVNR